MHDRKSISLFLGLAGMVALTGERVAAAQEPTDEGETDTSFISEYGIGLSVGGAVEDFTDSGMQNTASVGGNWDVRLELAPRNVLSVELGYVGTASSIDAVTSNESGTLIGTTFETDLKGNLPTGTPFVPFAFAGIGWRHYDVTGADLTLAADGINDNDDLIEFPIGVGVGLRYEGIIADLRFTFRPVAENGLVATNLDPLDPKYADAHTWAIGARIGTSI